MILIAISKNFARYDINLVDGSTQTGTSISNIFEGPRGTGMHALWVSYAVYVVLCQAVAYIALHNSPHSDTRSLPSVSYSGPDRKQDRPKIFINLLQCGLTAVVYDSALVRCCFGAWSIFYVKNSIMQSCASICDWFHQRYENAQQVENPLANSSRFWFHPGHPAHAMDGVHCVWPQTFIFTVL